MIKDEEILKKPNEIWNKIGSLLKTKIDNKPMYNDKYIKIKLKIYNDKVYTNFQYNKIPKDNEYFTCLFVILLDSILANSGKNVIHKYIQKNVNMLKKQKKQILMKT